jgi:hypothetical protein
MLNELFKDQKLIFFILLIIIVIYVLTKNTQKKEKEHLCIMGIGDCGKNELTSFAIKSPHGNKYCAMHPSGKVICDANGVGPWEKVIIENTPSGTKALKSSHGKYCAVEDNNIMNCNRGAIGPWEQYSIEKNADDTVAIRSLKNNRYCSVQPNGDVICDREAKGPWENLDYRLQSVPSDYVECGVDGTVCDYSGGDVYYGVPDNYDIVSESRVQKSTQNKFTCLPTGFPAKDGHPVLPIGDPVPGVQKKCFVKKQQITGLEKLPQNINYVKGWSGNHVNPGGKVGSAEDCRQQALNSDGKYVAWGYRKQPNSTCFLYTPDFAPYNGNPSDDVHATGCLVPGDTVSSGCEKSKQYSANIAAEKNAVNIKNLPPDINYVKGWSGNHENPGGKVGSAEDCRQQALNSNGKYVAWGYRKHPNSTCFLYTPDFAPYNGNLVDDVHLTGCLVPGDKVSAGCEKSKLYAKSKEPQKQPTILPQENTIQLPQENTIQLPQNYAACGQDGNSCQFEFKGDNDIYYGVENKKLVKIPGRSITSGNFSCLPLGHKNDKGYPSLPVQDPIPGVVKSCYIRK